MSGKNTAPGAVPNAGLVAPSWGHLVVPIGIVVMLGAMIVPMPPFALDLLISCDIAISMIVLLAAVYIPNPVDFSVFPSTLLLLTIFRLALNLASTRRILMHGAEGAAAAGSVIQAFGQFVVGGNVVVGLVVFLVLLAIQFIVINHGATRISEVTARFTLDAMPGKQMAIDADLNAGLINEKEARERRKAVGNEAEFYGSMDGAIRFTQRDAIAALIIVAVNIIGGLLIGVLQQHMALMDAISNYTILTVGDGLVTSIPALFISVAGGLITTRSATGNSMGDDVIGQIFSSPRPLNLAAAALLFLAAVPGLPKVAFIVLGVACFAISRAVVTATKVAEDRADAEAAAPAPVTEEAVEPLLSVDPLALEVGYDLIGHVGSDGSGKVLDKIRGIRRQIAIDLGFVLPPVRIRDNLRLAPDQYSILLRGVEIASATIRRGCVLAIAPGGEPPAIEGATPTTEPAFGIDALWIPESRAEQARLAGCTVVDPPSVISTHLLEIVRRHAHELLGREDVQKLLELLSKTSPKTVEELIPERLTLGQVQSVLRSLLRERVPIRDLGTIVETLADVALTTREPLVLVDRVRQALGRTICGPLLNEKGELEAITIDPRLERNLELAFRGQISTGSGYGSATNGGSIGGTAGGMAGSTTGGVTSGGEPEGASYPVPTRQPVLGPAELQGIFGRIAKAINESAHAATRATLLSSPAIRPYLANLGSTALPHVAFISHQEVPQGTRVRSIGMVN